MMISLIVAFFTTPTHATMPRFWHEGCAQWAETAYSPTDSPWGGRGRDSLTHMVWRLAAASPEGLPEPADWRVTYQRWPYGTQTYIWGLAYLRYLDGAYGDRATIWQFIEQQEHQWPFCFNGGPRTMMGKDHATLIQEAREALFQEQLTQLGILRSQPVTPTRRLTPVDGVVSTPAWTKDGGLFAAYTPQCGDPHFIHLALGPGEQLHETSATAWAMGDARSLPDGTLTYAETFDSTNPWNRSQATVVTPGGHWFTLPEQRVLQVDLRPLAAEPGDPRSRRRYQLAALHLLPAAEQELMIWDCALDDSWLGGVHEGRTLSVPTQGVPWSPAFRPGHRQLAWVETDHAGSRLVLAPLQDLASRTVLLSVRGRILEPTWTSDGAHLFLCADHTGVCNAYCLDPEKPGTLVPVTNTIGGVVSCVPSPDGRSLAVIDCDLHGPYLAVISGDPATWAPRVPSITLAFPAPIRPDSRWAMAHPAPALATGASSRASCVASAGNAPNALGDQRRVSGLAGARSRPAPPDPPRPATGRRPPASRRAGAGRPAQATSLGSAPTATTASGRSARCSGPPPPWRSPPGAMARSGWPPIRSSAMRSSPASASVRMTWPSRSGRSATSMAAGRSTSG